MKDGSNAPASPGEAAVLPGDQRASPRPAAVPTRSAPAFAPFPDSWYYAGSIQDLGRQPRRISLPGGPAFAAYRTESGRAAVLAARCAHLGADLARGTVAGENLRCPLHGWEYAPDGNCALIPATKTIPGFARVTGFPVEERAGQVFFFNRAQPRFPLPFFEGVQPGELLAASEFEFIVDVPWYLASANGFDVQHFRCAHDRMLVSEPVVDMPHSFAWRLQATFLVSGNSFFDRLTRIFSGSRVTMTVTNWCGNLVLVTAQFRRTTSYGIVSFLPLDENRTLLRDVVLVPRSRHRAGRRVVDPLDAWLRRLFIREFVRSDVDRSAGIRFDPQRLIEADKVLADYINWLKRIHH